MSSDRDPPLFSGRSQQPRKGHLASTPESAFRRPPPPRDTSEQHPTSRSRHTTEPIRTGLATSSRPPTYTGPKPRYSGVSFKSSTSSSGALKSIPAHSQEPIQVSLTFLLRSFLNNRNSSTTERKLQDLRFRYQRKHHAPQIYQVDPVQFGFISIHH